MDFIKETFLKLTEYTIPYGKESTLEKYLPNDIKKDSIGNYFIKIGESETMFVTHLDTYCEEYEKVNHIINGDKISTDETTILGGDNKLGCTILLYMIKNNIPGLYYFFLSEEPTSPKGGRWGSLQALKNYENIFKEYKRCIAFDRKEKGSIVTRQLGRICCSDEFTDALSIEFSKNELDYKKDHKAYYTDSATFLDTIPECTNLSAGGYKEHYRTEWVDLSYTRKVAEAACNIDWDKLPTIREIDEITPPVIQNRKVFNKVLVYDIEEILSVKYDHLWTNKKRFLNGVDDYMLFNSWFEDTNIKITPDFKIKLKYDDKEQITTNTKGLDLLLNDIFGVPFDYSILGLDEDGNVNIETEDGKVIKTTLDKYIEYFNKINPANTTYVIGGSKRQFVDYGGDIITKQQFIKWLKQNDLA
jgi:hypothetical protein